MRIDPVQKLISDVQTMLEQMNWPTPYRVAQALGLKIVNGPVAGINLEPPPMIHLPDHLIGFRRSHTLAHEIAHALLAWREIDDELLTYYAPECAYSNLEALANYIAGLICFPQPFYEETLRRFDFSPDALLHLAKTKEAPLPLAMERAVYESDSYHRAALLFRRGFVIDYATTIWLDIEAYDEIKDPEDRFPGILLKPVTGHSGLVLGTWGG